MTHILGLLPLLLVWTHVSCSDVILSPVEKGTRSVALILIQGHEIKPEQYVPLASEIQNASEQSLWVGIPEYTLDQPLELDLDYGISRVLKSMTSAGMNTSTFFFTELTHLVA